MEMRSGAGYPVTEVWHYDLCFGMLSVVEDADRCVKMFWICIGPTRPADSCTLKWFAEKMDGGVLEAEASAQMHQMPNSDAQLEVVNEDEEPRVGMEFSTEESAYDFYNRYARRVGFSVRKTFRDSSGGILKRRQFCCSKEGKKIDKSDASYHRATTRTNCPARMIIKRQKSGNYVVYRFEATHNHEVVPPSQVHMLRSHRKSADAQKDEGGTTGSSKKKPKPTMDNLGEEAGGNEILSFESIDRKKSLSGKRMKEMEKGDARAILDYLEKKQLEDPSFFYAFQLDVDDKITNIFWADANSIMDYRFFGDVVCFDTTYRINSYGRPFASFVGINHHKQTIPFGAAFLYDETMESFKWLFETFLNAMCGKPPVTIMTDQCAPISEAIAIVLPETFHRICVWHIYQHAAKHLSNVFHGSKSFQTDFRNCVCDIEDEEEFLRAWHNMLFKYNLSENEWLKDLYELRVKWAFVYGRNIFCAGMKTILRSERMNSVLKEYLNSKYDLWCFFKHYEQLLADCRYNESKADFKMRHTTPRLFIDVKMLKEASIAYTPEVFEMFQKEYEDFLKFELFKRGEEGTTSVFEVTCDEEENSRYTVTYDSSDNTVTCSCKKFEFSGILCSHVVKVFDFHNIKALPPRYILKRWCRDSKDSTVLDNHGPLIEGDDKEATRQRYNILYRRMIALAAIASKNDEMFKFAQKYCDKFHEEVDGVKVVKELSPQPHETVDDRSVESENLAVEKESQTVSGSKTKKKAKGGRRPSQNSIDKDSQKKCQSEHDHLSFNQEREETLPRQGQGILHQPAFQAPYYPPPFPILNQFGPGSFMTRPVMGYVAVPGRPMDASLAAIGHRPSMNLMQPTVPQVPQLPMDSSKAPL